MRFATRVWNLLARDSLPKGIESNGIYGPRSKIAALKPSTGCKIQFLAQAPCHFRNFHVKFGLRLSAIT